jgi:hypothetical protein
VYAVEVRHHGAHLVAGEHRGHPLRAPGAHRLLDAQKVDPQNSAVEEQEGAERLVLHGRGHVALYREPGEERLDLARAQLARMPLAVVHHEPVHPLRVRPLRAQAEVLQARGLPDLVQELRFGHRPHGGCGGMGCVSAHVASR